MHPVEARAPKILKLVNSLCFAVISRANPGQKCPPDPSLREGAVDLYCLSTQVHEKDNKGVVGRGVERGYYGVALG